jgi:oligoribonuclease NrnB/cAMP/cGMP phosphodiesterase (DHH superfamily)
MTDITGYFHRIDYDGKNSAYWIKKWADLNSLSVKLIGINYGETFDPEDVKNKTVIISDFTFLPGEMFNILALAKEVIWLDHHKTSINDMTVYMKEHNIDNPFRGIQKLGFGGCALTWLYFFGCNHIERKPAGSDYCELASISMEFITHESEEYLDRAPMLVQLLSTYDTWDLRSNLWADALDLQYALKQFDLQPDSSRWNVIVEDALYLRQLVEEGPKFREYTNQQQLWYMDEYGYQAIFSKGPFAHLKVYAMNTGFKGSNNFVDRMEKYDVLLAYVHKADGTFTCSVYSATGTDVSVIAKFFGGGGHPGAAGFTVSELPVRRSQ